MLPRERDYCIILFEDKPEREHWKPVSKYNGLYKQSGPYGVKPNSELEKFGEMKSGQLNSEEPYLIQLTTTEEERTSTTT